jgi:transglutaminase-like putative cysteine protease
MEVRMQPRSDASQRCIQFSLTTSPVSRVLMYQDHDGNIVHHFGIPAQHSLMTLTAEALVEVGPAPLIPYDLGDGAWAQIDALTASGEFWEYLNPSAFTPRTARLDALASEVRLGRGEDPLLLLRRLNAEVFDRFEYAPKSTRVDSPIDDALEARKGVCQDFAHILIALVRQVGIPARYVSGYLSHGAGHEAHASSHAWADAYVEDLGWVSFDPSNRTGATQSYIRIAIGLDYAEAGPIRGVRSGGGVETMTYSVMFPSQQQQAQ